MHNKLQKEALWKSAEHYLENWQDIYTASIGAQDCACCQWWADNDCEGCPIKQHTGMGDCEGTPWHPLHDEMHDEDSIPEAVRELLEAEYRFLVQLVLEPYVYQEMPTVRYQKDTNTYVVIRGQVEVGRFNTKWAATRLCRMLAEKIQDDGGAQ